MTRRDAYNALIGPMGRFRGLLARAGPQVPEAIDVALATLALCAGAESEIDPETRAPPTGERVAALGRLAEGLRACGGPPKIPC